MAQADLLLAQARGAIATHRLDDARRIIARGLALMPQHAELHLARAYVELAAGDPASAAQACREVLLDHPANVVALNLLGEALHARGDAGAEDAWRRALAVAPDNAEAWFHLGNLHAGRGEQDAAIDALQRASLHAPGTPSVLVNLGVQLDAAGRSDEAEQCYRRVLAVRPQQLEALANLAALLFRAGRHAEALPLYDRIVALDPHAGGGVWNNRGVCQRACFRSVLALQSFARAAALAPASAEVLANYGLALCEARRYAEARPYLARAQALAPGRLQVAAQLLEIDLHGADWTAFDARRAALVAAVEHLPADATEVVPPFAFMAICDDPRLQLRAAARFAWPPARFASAAAREAPATASTAGGRLRIGFVSTALHEHPVPRLIVPLLEQLDRGRFDVHAYLVARAVHHPLRRRVEASTTLRDLAGASTAAIVQQIRADAIDILIDVAGHTEHARGDVFAQRPAPLQVNYLGHAGTLGAPYYDAIVTDAYATPPALQAHFSEPFWYLPYCYFPCDVSSPLAPMASRARYGLPDAALVFMSQAAAYKLIPPVFDAWLRMLRAVPDAVLWLRPMAAPAPANLHARAGAHGVDPARIHFAPEETLSHYRSRFRLADLYLDTHPFGSHTTVSDALWAGLPVLTLAGRSMAGRASASQVRAAGLPELVTDSLEAYEALACSLAADRATLATLTARLRGECRAAPLFDRTRYLRDFAQGLLDLWSRQRAGHAPRGA